MVVDVIVYSYLRYFILGFVFFCPLVLSSISPYSSRLNISLISCSIVLGFRAVFLRFFAYCVKASIRVTRKVQEPLKPPLLAISSISKNWLSDIERFILLRLLIVVNHQSRVCQFLPELCKRKYQSPRCYALTLARWYTSYRFALHYTPGASR